MLVHLLAYWAWWYAITVGPIRKRHFIVRFRKVAKGRDRLLKCSYRFEIWQVPLQQCCRCAYQISKKSENYVYRSSGAFETLWDITKIYLMPYWIGPWVSVSGNGLVPLYTVLYITCDDVRHQIGQRFFTLHSNREDQIKREFSTIKRRNITAIGFRDIF